MRGSAQIRACGGGLVGGPERAYVEHAVVIHGVVNAESAPHDGRDARRVRAVNAVAVHEIGHVVGLAHLPRGRPAGAERGVVGCGAPKRFAPGIMSVDVAVDGVTSTDRAALPVWYAIPLGRLCDPTTTP